MSQEIPVVYPTPEINPPASSHHSSNGSFGSVFIVLAVIVVISAIACFLGRLCNKRYHKADKQISKDHRGKEGKKQKQAFPKKEWEPKHNQTRDHGDIEFGFDAVKRVPTAKVAANNGTEHAAGMGPSRSFRNGEFNKGEMRFPAAAGGDHHAAMGAPMRFPGGGDGAAAMGAPMRFPGGDHHAAMMGPSRSFRNGEFKGEMRFPEGGGEHRAGPVIY